MRHASMRAMLLTGAGLGGAVLWGVMECLALLRSRLSARLAPAGRLRAH